ncbi:MAG: hypothetical protein FWD65_08665 [Coriobacteriia bacterium]|nr:hypothetical protein [Coriobacteriia bacterium]
MPLQGNRRELAKEIRDLDPKSLDEKGRKALIRFRVAWILLMVGVMGNSVSIVWHNSPGLYARWAAGGDFFQGFVIGVMLASIFVLVRQERILRKILSGS